MVQIVDLPELNINLHEPTVLVLHGIPASGKTAFAKELVRRGLGKWKRVNRDDIRAMMDNSRYTSENEKLVVEVRDQIILAALRDGKSVVVDDTNLNTSVVQQMLALVSENLEETVPVFYEYLHVSLDEAILRDSKRENPVGEHIIREMHDQYTLFISSLKEKGCI